MKIGIVLHQYPVKSETFINTFLEHLSDHQIYLYTKLLSSAETSKKWKIQSYLNSFPPFYLLFEWILSFVRIPFYYKRFLNLRSHHVPFTQLITDAPIWTTKVLDVLHFPFGNNSLGREHYASLVGAKMTVSFRGSDLNVYTLYHNRSYVQIWPFIHKVHCNSIELAEKLKQHKINTNIPIEIIPPAIRSDLNINIFPKDALQKTSYFDTPFIIVTIGRLHWVKDYPLALRSLAELKKKGIKFKYHILGEGVEREQLMFLIQDLGLFEEVCLFGTANAYEIKMQLSTASIYLQTSLAEGFSNTCLEAQAFGLPCIVPAISGMRDCVEDGKTGIIVKDRSEKAFADAILTIINNIHNIDPSYISKRVKLKFSLDNQRQQWVNFFKEFHN